MNNIYYQGYDIHTIKDICKDFFMNNITSIFFFFIYTENIPIVKLADLENLEGEECILIGTLYKHQQWKPSILRELSEDHQLNLSCSKSDYCSEKDQSFLEDEMLRIKLVGNQVNLKQIVTGVVCAVLGNENSDGTFMVIF